VKNWGWYTALGVCVMVVVSLVTEGQPFEFRWYGVLAGIATIGVAHAWHAYKERRHSEGGDDQV